MFIIKISFALVLDHFHFGIVEQTSKLCQVKYSYHTIVSLF